MKTTLRKLTHGWQPDLPDHRDLRYIAPEATTLPPAVDLRPQCPSVYDQGQLGSCTANAIGAAIEFDLDRQKLADFMPSRLFIYYNERAIEHTVKSDSGAQIRDGIKSVAQLGVCDEIVWPYVVNKFANKPKPAAYKLALGSIATVYRRLLPTLADMRGCLAEGSPFVIGFSVYESFEGADVAKSGVVNLPKSGEKLLGGHAVLVVGYDDQAQRFIVRNSWGSGWGLEGYFTMPYGYLTNPNLSDDFWCISTVK